MRGNKYLLRELKRLHQRAIHTQRFQLWAFDIPFYNQRPIVLSPTIFEQILKGNFDGTFVEEIDLIQLAERLVVGGDGLVMGFGLSTCM